MSKSCHRRVQAFILPLYEQHLIEAGFEEDDIDELIGPLRATVTYVENGKLACMLCDPWPRYCPDYDRGKEHCDCDHPCDFEDDSYKPKRTFNSLRDFWNHLFKDHNNHKLRPMDWFNKKW